MKLLEQWIEIFRAGKYPVGEFTEEDIDEIIERYDPGYHEAPVVIGHPKDDAPAYGWVEKLKRAGKVLYAKFKEIVPELEEMVKKGLYKKRSAAFYDLTGTDEGGYYLRHVGFLGASVPAVKGLADVKFQDDVETIEFQGTVGLFGKLKNIEMAELEPIPGGANPHPEGHSQPAESKGPGKKFKQGGSVEMDEQEVEKKISEAKEKAKKEAAEEAAKEFSEKSAEQEKESEKLKKENEDLKTEKEKQTTEARKGEIKTFIETQVKEAKALPRWKDMGLIEFMEGLSDEKTIEFTENDEKKKKSAYEFFKNFLEDLPKFVEFKEIVKDGETKQLSKEEMIHKEALKFAEEQKISYKEAVFAVEKEKPELFKDVE